MTGCQWLGIYMIVGFFLMMPALRVFADDMKRQMKVFGSAVGLSEKVITRIIIAASFIVLLTWPVVIVLSLAKRIK